MRKRYIEFYANIHLWLSGLWRFGLCLVIGLVSVTLMDFLDMYQIEANRYELKKGYSLVKGVVYDVNTLRKVRKMYYSYVINGIKYKDDSEYGVWEKKYGRAPEEGDSVLVCYKKTNPEINMLLEYLDYESTYFVHKWAKEVYLKIHAKNQVTSNPDNN